MTYLPNGGTGSFTDTGFACGSGYTVRTNTETGITRMGYTFIGWNTRPDGSGITYQPGDTLTVLCDVALYAQWAGVPGAFSVTYLPNGGTGSFVDSDLLPGSSYVVRTDVATGIVRAGSTFIGWNTQPDGSGITYQPGDLLTITGNVTLYAQWTVLPGIYSVTYLPNGGTGSFVDSGLLPGSSYTVRTEGATGITRVGYTFLGWNTQPGGGGIAYQPGTVIMITGDLVLYAQWGLL